MEVQLNLCVVVQMETQNYSARDTCIELIDYIYITNDKYMPSIQSLCKFQSNKIENNGFYNTVGLYVVT